MWEHSLRDLFTGIRDRRYGLRLYGYSGGIVCFPPLFPAGCARSPLIIKAATGTEHGEGTCRDRPFSTSGSTFSGRRCRGREGCSAIGRPAGGRHRGSHPPVLGGSLARLVWDWVLWCFAVGCVRSVGAGEEGAPSCRGARRCALAWRAPPGPARMATRALTAAVARESTWSLEGIS